MKKILLLCTVFVSAISQVFSCCCEVPTIISSSCIPARNTFCCFRIPRLVDGTCCLISDPTGEMNAIEVTGSFDEAYVTYPIDHVLQQQLLLKIKHLNGFSLPVVNPDGSVEVKLTPPEARTIFLYASGQPIGEFFYKETEAHPRFAILKTPHVQRPNFLPQYMLNPWQNKDLLNHVFWCNPISSFSICAFTGISVAAYLNGINPILSGLFCCATNLPFTPAGSDQAGIACRATAQLSIYTLCGALAAHRCSCIMAPEVLPYAPAFEW